MTNPVFDFAPTYTLNQQALDLLKPLFDHLKTSEGVVEPYDTGTGWEQNGGVTSHVLLKNGERPTTIPQTLYVRYGKVASIAMLFENNYDKKMVVGVNHDNPFMVIKYGVYKHLKSNVLYCVNGLSLNEETGELMVNYSADSNQCGRLGLYDCTQWVRPLSEFSQKFEFVEIPKGEC